MSLFSKPLLRLVRSKFLKCHHALEKRINFLENSLDEDYFIGVADYDPITAEFFLDELYSELSTEQAEFYYLDIDEAKVVRSVLFEPNGRSNAVNEFKSDHCGLYGASLDGSYFAVDKNQLWSIFYDAAEDIFLLHIKDISRLKKFSDFLLPQSSD